MRNSNGVLGAGDAPLPDDGNAVVPRHLVHLVDLQQGHRFDRRPGQAALIVADHGRSAFHVHGHSHQGVDDGEGIGAGLDTASGIVLRCQSGWVIAW